MKSKILYIALAVLLFAVMCFSGWKVYSIWSEYRAGEAAYDDLNQLVVMPGGTGNGNGSSDDASLPELDGMFNVSPDGPSAGDDWEDAIIWPWVDFDALREINPDVVGWIYIEGTQVSYPIVQRGDNSYYLDRLFTGQWNGAGSIFMDYRNNADFSDPNSILYGHHMKNGTMFADISEYKQQDFYDEHPTGMILTPEGNYLVEFFAGYVASTSGDSWQLNFTDDEFESWLSRAKNRSRFASDVEVTARDRVVTLSTCTYEYEDARFVLVGVLRP